MTPPVALRVAEFDPRCGVLGPGVRAVVWVQGCPLRCPGCITPEYLPSNGGTVIPVDIVAEQITSLPDIDGVTFSGGEPFAQADPLAELVDLIRADRDLSVMAYSGFTLDHLRRRGDDGQRRLLDRLDILVDGPYLRARHGAIRWRGSTNQALHVLTDRHRDLIGEPDVPAGMEITVRQDGVIDLVGVPPVADSHTAFFAQLAEAGIRFDQEEQR